jgi:hypothetical protein
MGVQAVVAGQGGLRRVTGVVGFDADLIAVARPALKPGCDHPVQRRSAGGGN